MDPGVMKAEREGDDCDTSWSQELRLVLIGKAGSDKSASGNTILGRRQCLSEISGSSVTKICELGSVVLTEEEAAKEEEEEEAVTGRKMRRVTVVDMPGFGDTHLSREQIHAEIAKCVCLFAPGPHAFLLVVPLGRYTDNVKQAVSEMSKIFGEEALRHHTLVLFTRGDDLEGTGIEEFLRKTALPGLKALIDRCGNRYHVLINKDQSNSGQVKELLMKVDMMVRQTTTGFYTKEMYLEAEAASMEEQERILRKYVEEMRGRVEIMVAAGATGMAFGAMFGIAVPLVAAAGAYLVGNSVGFVAGKLAGMSVAGDTGVGNAVGAIVAAASGKMALALGATGGAICGSVGAHVGTRAASPREGALDALGWVNSRGFNALRLAAGVGGVLGAGAAIVAVRGGATVGTAALGAAETAAVGAAKAFVTQGGSASAALSSTVSAQGGSASAALSTTVSAQGAAAGTLSTTVSAQAAVAGTLSTTVSAQGAAAGALSTTVSAQGAAAGAVLAQGGSASAALSMTVAPQGAAAGALSTTVSAQGAAAGAVLA